MKRLLIARMTLTAIGVGVWWYGNDDERLRLAAIGILLVAVLMRFVPKHWLGIPPD